MKELTIHHGRSEELYMLHDKAMLQVDGSGKYEIQASLDGEHWSVHKSIAADCKQHSRTVVVELLAGVKVRVVCVTGHMEAVRYAFSEGVLPDEIIDSEHNRIVAESARIEAEQNRVAAENAREKAEASREAAEAQRVSTFESNEATREATFENNEKERQQAFAVNEAAREATFTDNEEQRQQAFDNINIERGNIRISGYADTVAQLPTDKAIGTVYGVKDAEYTDESPKYRVYVYTSNGWIDNGLFNGISAGVVQETGDSESLIMSQKAVSEEVRKLELGVESLENRVSMIDGYRIDREFSSMSSEYYVGYIYPTTDVSVGSIVSATQSTSEQGCFVITCKKGAVITSRTRYDSDGLWMVVDENFKVVQMAVREGLVETEQTIQVTDDNAAFFIANHFGYEEYNHDWVRLLYNYVSGNKIEEIEENVNQCVKLVPQDLTQEQKEQVRTNVGINDVQYSDDGTVNLVIKELYIPTIEEENITQLTIQYGTLTSDNTYRAKVSLIIDNVVSNAINSVYDTQESALLAINGVLCGLRHEFFLVIDTKVLTAGEEYNYTNLNLNKRCKHIELCPVILDYISRTFIFKNIVVGNVASWGDNPPFSFRGDLTYSISGTEIVVTNVGSAGYNIYKENIPVIDGHLYYMSARMQSADNGDGLSIVQNGNIQTSVKHSGDGTYQFLSLAHRFDTSATSGCSFRVYNPSNTGIKQTRIKFITILDLSEIFGVGKEPDLSVVDGIITNCNGLYIDTITTNTFDLSDLKQEIDSLNSITGEGDNNVELVVNPLMSGYEFATAINNKKSDYAELCKCFTASFENLDTKVSLYENYEKINHNFRKDIAIKGKSLARLCADINKAFTEPIYRFCDAKLGDVRKMSLSTNMQADEPSAIVSDDGNTLYIYAHLKRISTVDGIHWSSPIDTPLVGEVSYIMHNNVNYIDGVFYMIGATSNSGGDLCLFTSVDGINFTYRGVLFTVNAQFGDYYVKNWGNTYLHKDRGSEKYYLYIEYQAEGRFWEIALAMCTNILLQNSDGTIGDWVYPSTNPIITQNPNAAGNPDLAKIGNELLKVNGKYFMYFHGTSGDGISNIFRAWSKDLIEWHNEGVIFDNRDQPTGGDNTSGNADHCVIEFKGRTYLFYTWDINNPDCLPYIKYTIDNRSFHELLEVRP